jgi:hypothetical protein
MKKWKILARHKWVVGAIITESITDDNTRRFTATIRGWRNWKIWEGKGENVNTQAIMDKVISLRDRIDANDQTVFTD